MKTNVITVDWDEIPPSHSSAKVYEDEHVRVSVGSGNNVADKRRVVLAGFPQLGLEVIGGESLYDWMGTLSKEKWYKLILDYVVNKQETPDDVFILLMDLVEVGYQRGKEEGADEVRRGICGLLNVRGEMGGIG